MSLLLMFIVVTVLFILLCVFERELADLRQSTSQLSVENVRLFIT